MAGNSMPGTVQTVLGPIAPADLGQTLTHEHMLIDLTVNAHPPASASGKAFFDAPVSMETVGRIRHYKDANFDDAQLFDVDTAIDEVALYGQHGGGSLVDATSVGIARDPAGLARISRATGVNIVMGASYYVAATHPPDMDRKTEAEIAGEIVTDVTEGAGGTRIRSGVIGEVGCSWPLTDNERKVLRASARAQRATGAPVLIHPGRDETAPLEIIEVLREAGADLDRTIMGHLDRTVFVRDNLKRIAEAGCYMEWDLFGNEASYYPLNPNIDFPSEARRMDDISWISAQGYGRKVLVAHDICAKHRLQRYGGHGYYYILRHLVPRMLHRGYSREAVDDILVNNPANILTFVEPQG